MGTLENIRLVVCRNCGAEVSDPMVVDCYGICWSCFSVTQARGVHYERAVALLYLLGDIDIRDLAPAWADGAACLRLAPAGSPSGPTYDVRAGSMDFVAAEVVEQEATFLRERLRDEHKLDSDMLRYFDVERAAADLVADLGVAECLSATWAGESTTPQGIWQVFQV